MPISPEDRKIIRDLAAKVADIARHPVQQQRKQLWMRLNRLERVRPLIHVQAIAPDIWEELIPPSELRCVDAFCRGQELQLRRKIYCWENLQDDRVVDDVVVSPLVIRGDISNIGFGPRANIERSGARSGAHAYRTVIVAERDIEKINTTYQLSLDQAATEKSYQLFCDVYDGVLRVEKRGRDFFWFAPMDTFITWRGIEQMFTDLLDRPKWVHEALERITTAWLNNLDQLEKLNALSLGNRNTMLGSGGYGWTDLLPQPDFDGTHVRLKDLWARAATQIFTEGISPEMHDEFAIQYEKRLLERFGFACYGCCEPLHRKVHVMRKIRNLRRVSMSPWVDIDVAAAAVGRDFVYTHKPNPAILSMEQWHPELARAELRTAFEKTRSNIVEVNLQDIHTVRNEPRRLADWTRMAMELSGEFA